MKGENAKEYTFSFLLAKIYMQNKIILITYADSLGKNLNELEEILENHFKDAIGGIHILPFFPSSADRGFAPICYKQVDPEFGNFDDLVKLSKHYDLTYDFMVNHISKNSEYFNDFKEKKELSKYKDFFIRYKDFWQDGEPTQEQIDKIYKRKPRAPYIEIIFADGSTEKLWCTFCDEQIDLNIQSKVTKEFIEETLVYMCQHGAKMIRLDAFAYAIKKADTSCFFIEPEIWNLLYYIQNIVKPYKVEVLPEIHEHYEIQLKIAEKGFWVYDFALPMLVLYSLYTADGLPLKNWLDICPRKQMTTLDTHDGIGVVDVADLLNEEQISITREMLYSKGANVKKKYSSEEYHNLDIYQINCSYYSALGNNDDAYLLARAIQFFAPGIPQVYYVGLLAGENDIELLEKTKEGRNINRHYYTKEEVAQNMKRPIIQKLKELMVLRNTHPAFDGDCYTSIEDKHLLTIKRINGNHELELKANLKDYTFTIK